MELNLHGKTAIVTGASRGIGLATATALLREGADVAFVARHEADLVQAIADLGPYDGRALAVMGDTTDTDSIARVVERTREAFGPVNVLVNAGADAADATRPNALQDLREEDLMREIDTKVLGYLRCARAVAPDMAGSGWGRIVNVGGLGARSTGAPFNSIRNVAVAAMTKNLADELGPSGINVNAVHPGMTVTARIDEQLERIALSRGSEVTTVRRGFDDATSIGRMVTAAEVAEVIVFLCSPQSVAVAGEALAVGGGQRGVIHY